MAARKATKPAVSSGDSAQTGANPEVTVIEFRGQKFTIPADRGEWPTRAVQAFSRRLNVDAVELLFGPAQWDRLNRIAPTLEDFWEFFPVFALAAGLADADDLK